VDLPYKNVYQWEKKVLNFPLYRLQPGQIRWDKKKEKGKTKSVFYFAVISFHQFRKREKLDLLSLCFNPTKIG
jgi:hypothetical protein